MDLDREPGWYDDPQDPSNQQQRWWNGGEWTLHVVPTRFSDVEKIALSGRALRAAAHGYEDTLLDEIRIAMHEMALSGEAVDGRGPELPVCCDFDVGGAIRRSATQLMLRTYNTEADRLFVDLDADQLNQALHVLEVVRLQIDELGASLGLSIAPEYHDARRREFELIAQRVGRSNDV